MKRILILFFVFCFLFFSCGIQEKTESRIVFNTLCRISFFYEPGELGLDASALMEGAFLLCEELYRQIDVVDSSSYLNGQLALGGWDEGGRRIPIVLSGYAGELFELCMVLAEITGGAFDPTIAPLVGLWGIGMGGTSVPSLEEINRVLLSVGFEKVVFVRVGDEVVISDYPDGFGLDFGAAGKGYAARLVADYFVENGVSCGILNIGGNVTLLGDHPDDRPWRIGVQDPLGVQGEYSLYLDLMGSSISTSGVYERFFIMDGRRYHHLLDGVDGFPVMGGLLSVTVVSVDPLLTDVFSTALFVMGDSLAKLFVGEEKNGVDALFLYENGDVWMSKGFADFYVEIDESGVE